MAREKQMEMQRLTKELAARIAEKHPNTPPELIELALVISRKMQKNEEK